MNKLNKKFNDNRRYSIAQIANVMEEDFLAFYKDKVSFTGSINNHIIRRKELYGIDDGKKRNRKFSGSICNRVYDFYAEKYGTNAIKVQMSFDDVERYEKSSDRLTICLDANSPAGVELMRRCRAFDLSKKQVIEQALACLCKHDPMDDYDDMSIDELKAQLRARDLAEANNEH